jgi:uncharacterized protein involved in exopolysaccharide biosynthesis
MAEPAAAQLEALSALVQQAKAVPMSASCMVNRSEALALIESARTALTDELTAARDATNASPPALERAKAEAEQIVRAAQEKADRLVDSSEVLKTARARAGDLQAQAAAEAEALRKEADVYVDFRIAAMEAGLQKTLSQIQTMRSRLETRSGLHAPETTVLSGGPSGTPAE